MYDAIVVGARVAGSPTALLLARKGYRVLLVDRASFPADTLSTHLMHVPAVARLKRWGLLERVAASNSPPIFRTRLDVGPFALVGTPPALDGIDWNYCTRRTVLDKILVDAAAESGAEVRENFTVDEVLMEEGQVTGIQGHRAGGKSVKEQAHIVVGADGLHSLVARTVNAPIYHEMPTMTCTYYTYWSGVLLEGNEIYQRPQRIIASFPTNNGLTCIYIGWPVAEFPMYRANIEDNYRATLKLAPGLAERVRNGRREEHFRGTADLPNFFRKPYGAGWALVGDAGYHKDPALAYGISDAFLCAELLAEALDAGLSERQPMDDALALYEQRRNEKLLPYYQMNCQIASLEPPSIETQQLFGALSRNQVETNNFTGALQGVCVYLRFFSPANVMRIMSLSG